MKKFLVIDRGRRSQPVSYSQDWIDSLREHSGGQVDVISDPWLLKWGKKIARLMLSSHYDGIIVMHSVSNDFSFGTAAAELVRTISGPVVMFLGNEYKLLSAKIDLAHDFGCAVVFSQLPLDVAQKLYGPYFAGKVLSIPHALNEKAFSPSIELKNRINDIGYRGEKYPLYLGHDERAAMFDSFEKRAAADGLKVDFASGRGKGKRLNRTGWAAFLNSCRATVATETGANYLSMSEKLRISVNVYQQKNPAATPENVERDVIFPLSKEITFINGRAISSRHFDAIGCNTAIISFKGRFNDILKADEHYLMMNDDFSNIDDVIGKIRSNAYLEDLTTRTREYVLRSHCLKHRVQSLMQLI
jgi:hypothetical protein